MHSPERNSALNYARVAKFMTPCQWHLRRVALDGVSFDYEEYGTGGITAETVSRTLRASAPAVTLEGMHTTGTFHLWQTLHEQYELFPQVR